MQTLPPAPPAQEMKKEKMFDFSTTKVEKSFTKRASQRELRKEIFTKRDSQRDVVARRLGVRGSAIALCRSCWALPCFEVHKEMTKSSAQSENEPHSMRKSLVRTPLADIS